MSPPFPRGLPKLLDKNAGRIIPGRHRADGYDLFVTSHTYGAPRPLADKLSAGSERETRGREAMANEVGWQHCGRRRTDRIMRLPYSYSPSVQPYSGGEASQAIGRVAREPREGEIPVELSQAAVRSAYYLFWIK